ncbi:hypothetical protein [Herbaspirillum robiniae]|uniref:hypothetical protein n=1 Tax=Herbaspirillum robiniae TaxID=2014887 RepID=UPI003D77FB47
MAIPNTLGRLPACLFSGLGIVLPLVLINPACAQGSADPADGGASQASSESALASACVDVEVNGVRSRSYDCLTEKLKPKAALQAARTGGLNSEQIVNQPSNQLGLFNRAAMANRMGNTFGTSVYPQRPPASSP